jgi:aryl-alcohol dehydrogenase-like predicted oxidoreductase
MQLVVSGGGFRLGRKSLLSALRASLKGIGQDKVDLYQVTEISFDMMRVHTS